MTQKIAFITGVNGQDGALLADFLLRKQYQVHGLIRRISVHDSERLNDLGAHPDFHLHTGDLGDLSGLLRILDSIQPHEIYHLAAQSHVGVSFENPILTAQTNVCGTTNLLEAIRLLKMIDQTRFYQASSSEIFGNVPAPQDENTPFRPCSPYAVSKLHGYWMSVTYRHAYGLFASNGILFNHESALRGEEFVTRKITKAIARIKSNMQDFVTIGNLDARRDWGHAKDYIDGMWRILQHDNPDDFVLATGKSYSVRDMIAYAFDYAGMPLRWEGTGLQERGIEIATNKPRIIVDKIHYRANDVHFLCGNATKAFDILKWKPQYSFHDLIKEMVDFDLKLLSK
jgi:GDPmannose 4,6-dehydratase